MPEIAALAADPSPLDRRLIVDGVPFTVRALRTEDAAALVLFLSGLSGGSRRFWHGATGHAAEATGWIEAIGRYDKLRLVAHPDDHPADLAGVADLSFSLPDHAELARYADYGLPLDPDRTVRWGPCVANAWQGRGLAAALLEPAWDAARLLARDRVVLFGGVHRDNHRARRFYLRHGFTEAGTFTTDDGPGIDMTRPI
ncbi:GNAT family N-acetyltransferase [Catenuloplanes japonicus]|uniref:GNAT family N-acetyltransferase n=1 Tax=Catenuloplanes japonicus TaxID=33876 RepID=UPI001E5FF185|nr:GNAT family N-acetyltransferase [Catenuloplanes japonicus]